MPALTEVNDSSAVHVPCLLKLEAHVGLRGREDSGSGRAVRLAWKLRREPFACDITFQRSAIHWTGAPQELILTAELSLW